MENALHFGPVLMQWPLLLWGLRRTLEFSVLSMIFGLAIGILGAIGKSFGPRPVWAW